MSEAPRAGVIRSMRAYLRALAPPAPATHADLPDDPQASTVTFTLAGGDRIVTSSGIRDNPRELRNKLEKQRRDKLNQSIAELASMVPPVVAANRKIDKTGVLRLTAHYLRAHQYVFGDTLGHESEYLSPSTAESILNLLNGFLLTTTYRGIVVVVSQNVHQYLGYKELDLLGQNIFSIVHPDDHKVLREQMTPKVELLGPNGELLVPEEPSEKEAVEDALTHDQRRFVIRFKKQGQRAEPVLYVTCHIEGSFRKSDRACRRTNRCCPGVRRARARSDNPCSSGNDVVFIGVVRPTMETFLSESRLESFRLEYRTRHSIDGEIIQCEQRISLVTGYMTNEVNGVNAMNFMHKDDVRWVIIALREMYVKKRLFGESCYRLMTKNGQFIYMRTRGCLDVDEQSRAVTTFVCTNTVVQEQEGKHLIRLMKKKFMLRSNNNENGSDQLPDDDDKEDPKDSVGLQVTAPRQLEKEILHLVTDLPSPASANSGSIDPDGGHGLALIPPRKERILSAIEKIYTVIKTFPKEDLPERLSQKTNLGLMNQYTQTEKPIRNSNPRRYPITDQTSKQRVKLTTFEDAFMPRETHSSFKGPDIINVEEYDEARALNRSIEPMSYFTANATVSMVPDRKYQPVSRIKYNGPRAIAPPPTVTDESIVDSYKYCALKRPIESNDCDGTLKRKNALEADNKEVNASQFSLDELLDEAISNAEISSLDPALQTLEEDVDDVFPELLLSKEVQDILGTIDNDPVDTFTSGT